MRTKDTLERTIAATEWPPAPRITDVTSVFPGIAKCLPLDLANVSTFPSSCLLKNKHQINSAWKYEYNLNSSTGRGKGRKDQSLWSRGKEWLSVAAHYTTNCVTIPTVWPWMGWVEMSPRDARRLLGCHGCLLLEKGPDGLWRSVALSSMCCQSRVVHSVTFLITVLLPLPLHLFLPKVSGFRILPFVRSIDLCIFIIFSSFLFHLRSRCVQIVTINHKKCQGKILKPRVASGSWKVQLEMFPWDLLNEITATFRHLNLLRSFMPRIKLFNLNMSKKWTNWLNPLDIRWLTTRFSSWNAIRPTHLFGLRQVHSVYLKIDELS